MHLKTFTADSLPDAMQQVREHLGEDAVILSTENDPDGSGVRVTAALEDADSPEGLFEGEDDLATFNLINEALDYHRVPLALTDSLLSTIGRFSGHTARETLARAIDAELSFAPLPRQATGYPIMLIGPPGAGKTATAAKLAAQVRVRGGKTTLVTLDTGKAGSLAQITAFAEALGANLREAHDADTLKRAIANCPKDHFVIVDSIGSGPYDQDSLNELSDWLKVSGAEGVLVMPAGGDAVETAEAALAYSSLGIDRMIATKMDSSRRIGGVLSAVYTAGLTLMGVGTAPTIGGGLRAANPYQIARIIVPDEELHEVGDMSPVIAREDEA